MKQKFAQFMYGRYGMDELSKFLSTASLIVLLVAIFIPGLVKTILWGIAIALLVFSYVRIFSKKYEKRRAENMRYLKMKRSVTELFGLRRDMWKQRKDYKFYKCPSCKAVLRVPKGKGRVRIVCKKCGTAFEKKT